MAYGNVAHTLHHHCAEGLIRRSRRESGGTVVVACIYCRRECVVTDMAAFRATNPGDGVIADVRAFRRTDPRPVPRRVLVEDGHGRYENESLEGYVRHWSHPTAPVDIIAHLAWDILRRH